MSVNKDNNKPVSLLPFSSMLFKKIEEIQKNDLNLDPNDGVYCKGSHSKTSHDRGGGYCKIT